MNEKQLRDIINGVFSGKYSLENLPHSLFIYTADQLLEAFESGWRTRQLTDPDIENADLPLFNSFRDNLWYFCANKTATQLKELQDLLHTEDGNRRNLYDFTKEALKVDKRYNRQYLAVEYDLTFKLANSGREWREIEDTADIFPYLEWVAVMDENTRHGHLNGIIRRVDDDFWITHPIPLEYGCRCRKRQHSQAVETDLSKLDLVEPPKRPWHANIVRNREVWKNREHPYGEDHSKETGKKIGQLVEDARMAMRMVRVQNYNNGGQLFVHPYHVRSNKKKDRQELETNLKVGNYFAKQGYKVELLPDGATEISPDIKLNNRVGDVKSAISINSIKLQLKRAAKQGEFAVLVLDSDQLTANDIYRAIKGEMVEGRKQELKRVYVLRKGHAILFERDKIGPKLQQELIKAESAVSWRDLRFQGGHWTNR